MIPEAALYNFSDYESKYDFTIGAIVDFIITYRHHPHIRRLAMGLINGIPERQHKNEAKTIFLYVRDCIPFRKDIRDVETVQTPVQTLELHGGDCDDKTVLLNALLESVGLKTRVVTVSNIPGGVPLTHVFSQVLIGNNWISMDTTRKVPFGAEPAGTTARNCYEY